MKILAACKRVPDANAQIRVRLAGHPRPMVAVVTRRLARFLNSLRREQS